MLFNSFEFLIVFLPVTFAVFFLIGRSGAPGLAALWLLGASILFYGWWDYRSVPLLLGSLLFNFTIGRRLAARPRRWLLAFGVGANLAALGWLKYSGFLAGTVNALTGLGLPVPQLVLPLAISFYTFQQIAYLVDAHEGETEPTSFPRYSLFVTFFPHLIAGPLVHHREMLAQFNRVETYRPQPATMALGLTVFAAGLFKKVLLADTLAPTAAGVIGLADHGIPPGLVDSWLVAVAFSLQLYFDFSGYSDMAVGLALLFGLRLPLNFNSPYKAASIIEFWSRWHMTLTRFLTTYLYNPMVRTLTRQRRAAGKPLLRMSDPRLGPFVMLVAVPTLLTMFLAGVWHGAGWQFMAFGLLHGLLLVANHAWRLCRRVLGIGADAGRPFRWLGVLATFAAVTVSLVFFKADSLGDAVAMVQAMSGLAPPPLVASSGPVAVVDSGQPALLLIAQRVLNRLSNPDVLRVLFCLAVVWFLPNVQQWTGGWSEPGRPAALAAGILLPRPVPAWRPNAAYGLLLGALFCFTLIQAFSAAPTAFLYFTF
jgi:D-alanyl-lipoteichoic acid acyltransferase DltB (MBOAT superfamily)